MSESVDRWDSEKSEGDLAAEGGAQRRRAPASRSGDPPSAAAAGESPSPDPVEPEDYPQEPWLDEGPLPEPPEPPEPDEPGGDEATETILSPEDEEALWQQQQEDLPPRRPRLTAGMGGRRTGSKRAKALQLPEAAGTPGGLKLTPQQRLLILDTWRRSGLPAGDFASLVGVTKHTLYSWKKKFEEEGPAGLMNKPRGMPPGSTKLPEVTRRTILMLKETHKEWGCQRISDMLVRGPGLSASASSVAQVLRDAGYQLEESPTRPHPDTRDPKDHVRWFERAKPNQLWQTDLFTFVLKRQNRRVYLVAFMDDHSRFIVGYGLHASQSAILVLEVFRAAVTSHATPQELLTDNGTQYVTWRGKSQFTRELEKRGVKHIVASPRRPQTLGKIERFWGTLWRECLETAVFLDLADAQRRIGLFIDYYNFQRTHQGLEGLTPADRFFHAAPEVKQALQQRVAANALELARNGTPKQPFYLTGQAGGRSFSVHAEGERVILTREGHERQEIDLAPPPGTPGTPGSPGSPSSTSSPDIGAAQPSVAPPGIPDTSAIPGPIPGAGAGAIPGAQPVPVCPQGVVHSGLPEMTQGEPPPPGVSPLDEGLKKIAQSFATPQPEYQGGGI